VAEGAGGWQRRGRVRRVSGREVADLTTAAQALLGLVDQHIHAAGNPVAIGR
jgi:hypothetical protein